MHPISSTLALAPQWTSYRYGKLQLESYAGQGTYLPATRSPNRTLDDALDLFAVLAVDMCSKPALKHASANTLRFTSWLDDL
jgi:hypothetical protein